MATRKEKYQSSLQKYWHHVSKQNQYSRKVKKVNVVQSPRYHDYYQRMQTHMMSAYHYYRQLMQMLHQPALSFDQFIQVNPHLEVNPQTQINPKLNTNVDVRPFFNFDPDLNINIGRGNNNRG